MPKSGIYEEPSLSVSFNAPDGSKKRIILTFPGHTGENESAHLKNEIENIIYHYRKSGAGNNQIRTPGYSPEYSVNQSRPRTGMGQYNDADRQYPHNYQRDPFQANTGDYSPEPQYSRSCEIPYNERRTANQKNPSINRGQAESYGSYGNKNHYSGQTGRDEYDSYDYESKSSSYGYEKDDYDYRTSEEYTRPAKRTKQKKVKTPRPKRRRNRNTDILGGTYSGGLAGSDSLIGTLIGLIISPDQTFSSNRRKELIEAVPVMVISLGLFALLSSVILGMMASSSPTAHPELSALTDFGTLIFIVIESVIFGSLAIFLCGIILYFVGSYEGFNNDMQDYIKVAAYSSAPFALAGIIPLFGIIIAPVWSIILLIKGLCENHSMNQNQAMFAVFIMILVFAMLFFMFIILGEDNFSVFGNS
ncbi:YIP1 family protein [Methanoplanus endosymbiosus]|uniref:YIP1 family protein n=1 Tax=Methanoplanus endosymbiosus TaxID=33865 RepID=A0A9E7PPB5_9EURY|nr:Yip1 family protein [Methanoplanus endosymbiosus]UUX91162.1 YIP1 family protein [Methanoplanus endosymbiosus]